MYRFQKCTQLNAACVSNNGNNPAIEIIPPVSAHLWPPGGGGGVLTV